MKSIFFAALAAALIAYTSAPAWAQGTVAKVHGDGKDKLVVESGGEIEFKSGSILTLPDDSIDTEKIDGTISKAMMGPDAVDTTKLDSPAAPAVGRLLCYTNDGKIGKVTAALETDGELDSGKVTACEAF